MTLEILTEEWAKDAPLDLSRPDAELRKIPVLHSTWWGRYVTERQRYITIKQQHDELRHAKLQWLLGRMDDEERQQRGWPLQHLRIVRPEAESFLHTDADLMVLAGKLEVAETKLKFLEDCIKHINGRGYLISTYVNYLKFSQGAA